MNHDVTDGSTGATADARVLERVARRLGMTEGQLWTIAVLAVLVALLLLGLRGLGTGGAA